MDDNAVQAILMSFAVFIFIIALSLAIFMFNQIVITANTMTFYSDSTRYYDNVKINDSTLTDEGLKDGTLRIVDTETIIPVLYRYYKENYCVKIYDDSNELVQMFDVNLEGEVHNSIGNTRGF